MVNIEMANGKNIKIELYPDAKNSPTFPAHKKQLLAFISALS